MPGKTIYCEFCHTCIHSDDKPVEVNGFFYHSWHTPEKTGKPKLNAMQLANLPDKSRATM